MIPPVSSITLKYVTFEDLSLHVTYLFEPERLVTRNESHHDENCPCFQNTEIHQRMQSTANHKLTSESSNCLNHWQGGLEILKLI